MSGMRLTIGIIAQLDRCFGDFNQEDHQNVSDYLDRIGSKLKLTYGGDMVVYIDQDHRTDHEGPGIKILENDMMSDFEEELRAAGLFVYRGTPKVFVDHWYDGADPSHLDISLEDAGYFPEGI